MRPSLHTFFSIITDVGDSACLAALVAAGGIYLISRGSRRAAVFLLASFVFSAGLIGFLKLAFLGCRNHFHTLDIHSPSGHAALSSAVFWAVSMLMRSQLEANRRFLPLAALTILIGLIAVSRVRLDYHNTAEVCLGLLAGYAGLMLARFFILRNHSLVPFDAYVLAIWCVVALFLTHGYRFPAEEWLKAVASHMHRHVSLCNITN